MRGFEKGNFSDFFALVFTETLHCMQLTAVEKW